MAKHRAKNRDLVQCTRSPFFLTLDLFHAFFYIFQHLDDFGVIGVLFSMAFFNQFFQPIQLTVECAVINHGHVLHLLLPPLAFSLPILLL